MSSRFRTALLSAWHKLTGVRGEAGLQNRLDDEVRFHIDMQAQKNQRLGMSPEDARRAAVVAFGATESFKEEARDEYRSRLLHDLLQDLRLSLRVLPRNRGYSGAVILTLTVGLGALSAVFTVFNSVLLQPLPFHAPERVVQIWSGTGANVHGPISSANFLDLRAGARSFAAIAAEDFAWVNLAGEGGAAPERLMANLVTSGFFEAVGARPALGNTFASDAVGAVVLSDRVWRQRFSADRSVIGRSILLNGEAYTVTGVMPAGFDFPGPLIGQRIDLWTPLAWTPGQVQRGIRELGITARLKDGVTLTQAQQDLDVLARRLAADYPDVNAGMAIRAVPLLDEIVGSSRRMLRVLLGAVALVLLIACSNVANLTLARGAARQQEVRLRSALGASRSRVARQLLTESVLLAVIGGAVGLFGAYWLTRILVALGPDGLPRLQEISTSWRVFAFTMLMSVVAGLLFGAMPAVAASRPPARFALGGIGRSITEGHERRGLRNGIVAAQVALSLVLLVGAGLLLRSFSRLAGESPGFEASGVFVARVSLDQQRYDNDARKWGYVTGAVERLAALPGVEGAGAVDYLPFGHGDSFLDISVEGRPPATPNEEVAAHLRSVTGGYFAAMRIGLATGRSFTEGDAASAAPVAIVNRAMARRYWPNVEVADLIGRRVRIGTGSSAGPWLTIVGVVGDVKHWNLGEEYGPELYMPLAQSPASSLHFVVRSTAGISADLLRAEMLAVDASQPVTIERLTSLVDASVSQPKFRALLFGFFAALALLLAVIGVYGVIAYRVSQRTREIGVRLALGARRMTIMAAVAQQGIVLTGAGIVLGLVGAFWLTRFLQGMLYRVSPTDGLTFLGVSLLLALTALLACVLPARRAAKVDPVMAMRGE
ncbi:MAG TPA: ABC transporter permease [Gemmatimonadaceae bacterium]